MCMLMLSVALVWSVNTAALAASYDSNYTEPAPATYRPICSTAVGQHTPGIYDNEGVMVNLSASADCRGFILHKQNGMQQEFPCPLGMRLGLWAFDYVICGCRHLTPVHLFTCSSEPALPIVKLLDLHVCWSGATAPPRLATDGDCRYFYVDDGYNWTKQTCPNGTLFDLFSCICNHGNLVDPNSCWPIVM